MFLVKSLIFLKLLSNLHCFYVCPQSCKTRQSDRAVNISHCEKLKPLRFSLGLKSLLRLKSSVEDNGQFPANIKYHHVQH